MLTMLLCPIPHFSFILSLSKPFLEVPLYWYGCVGTCCREIVFEMNCWSFWSYHLRARHTLSASSQPTSSPSLYLPGDSFFLSHLCPSVLILRLSSTKLSWTCSYVSHSILNIVPLLHLWSVIYFYLCNVRLLTLQQELVSWDYFLLWEHIQRGELLLITIWDNPSKGYYEE